MFASITGTSIYKLKTGSIFKARLFKISKFYTYLSSTFGAYAKTQLRGILFLYFGFMTPRNCSCKGQICNRFVCVCVLSMCVITNFFYIFFSVFVSYNTTDRFRNVWSKMFINMIILILNYSYNCRNVKRSYTCMLVFSLHFCNMGFDQ